MSVDLFRPFVAPDLAAAVAAVYQPDANGRVYIGEGPLVKRLQTELRFLFDAERPIRAVHSCTSAIELALHLCDVGPGDVVISTSMTCSATNTPVIARGASIAWADVDPRTGLIDPQSVWDVTTYLLGEGVVPKALVAVDWAGAMADYNALRDVCHKYGVPIIEDAAHSPLATHNGRYQTRVGGDYVCWSFGPIKHLSADNGGALLCPDDATTERARLLSWYGLDRESKADFRCDQDITEAGYKAILSDVSAAALLANLPHLQDVVYKHRRNAWSLLDLLKDVEGITLPPPDPGSSWWLFTVLLGNREERDGFIRFMGEKGIAASPVHSPNHRHSAMRRATHPASGPLPGTESFADRECAIPVGWFLSEEDVRTVASAVRAWSESRVAAKC
jgi:dTDP-4-amino-4,6-dideoxygalactose transaminase